MTKGKEAAGSSWWLDGTGVIDLLLCDDVENERHGKGAKVQAIDFPLHPALRNTTLYIIPPTRQIIETLRPLTSALA